MVLDYLGRIQLALDYMEQNLKTDINLKDLSRMADYSETYYSDLVKINEPILIRLLEHREELYFS